LGPDAQVVAMRRSASASTGGTSGSQERARVAPSVRTRAMRWWGVMRIVLVPGADHVPQGHGGEHDADEGFALAAAGGPP
jgi:hypothetical protein